MSTAKNVLTLDEFRFYEVRNFPHATGELSNLLRDIALAAKLINLEINRAGLVDILGEKIGSFRKQYHDQCIEAGN